MRRTLPTDWDGQVDQFAIVKLDGGGFVRGWNIGAELIKGYAAEEIVGEHFSRFYREEDRRRGLPNRLLADAQRDGHVEDIGWRVRKDGGEFWARVTISAIRSESGTVLGFVKIVRDLTSEKQTADEQAALQRTFAHDLLSPVTALRGYLDLLADELSPDHRLLQLAGEASDHLVAMAQALMADANARPERGRRRVTMDLIARGAVALVLPGDTPDRVAFGRMDAIPVEGDVLGLRRAVANVLENAAKYSDDVIDVQVYETDEGATLSVRDRGRGIHPDDLRVVLEEGERGRLADPRDGGSGIGLASVRHVVRAHGGRLRISSDLGVGTTVTLTIPRADDELTPSE
ncbi:PAS domain-containing sensor histidine kinase [Microbacterium enclense]|uniref:sensor histidine kinase n=1 Tax=Microbacterium enclense TaxID=993073 RepID=UPI0021A8BE49|nr:PAS domain-containing sensor histidine kinase [Microbacterium enclense]MCT2084879.1 PAS domain-containing sensor histidine kinase [Microbacterium enclense]